MPNWKQLLINRIGNPDADTLTSIVAKLGNAAQTFLTMVGYQGATSLADKLTAARAGYLDNINNAQLLNVPNLATLTAARIGYLDNINQAGLLQITAARAGYLDNINNAQLLAVPNLSTLSAARIGYLDNINQAGLLQVTAARAALLDQITALRMAELDAANLPTDLAVITAYVDLIDDATNGLAAIKAEVEGLAGAAMRGTDGAALAASWTAALATALGNYTALRAGYLDNINQAGLLQVTAARAALLDQITALRMAELDAANIPANVDTLLTRLPAVLSAARIGYLDNINQAGLLQVTAARAALLDQITAARLGELDAANIPADTDPKVMGKTQIFEKSITSAANAGDVLVATVTTQPCQIESVVIHADAAQTANMTSCGIFGGAGKVITFISAVDAVQANLNAADKQVGWAGVVRLAATKTIVISLVGTGAAAVDLTIVIKYRASVSGGYLA